MEQTGPVSPDGYWLWNGTQWIPNPYRPAVAHMWAPPFETARFRATMTTVFLVANAIALGLGILWTVLNIAYIQTPNPDQAFTAVWGVLALASLALLFGTLIPAGLSGLAALARLVGRVEFHPDPQPLLSVLGGARRLAGVRPPLALAQPDRSKSVGSPGAPRCLVDAVPVGAGDEPGFRRDRQVECCGHQGRRVGGRHRRLGRTDRCRGAGHLRGARPHDPAGAKERADRERPARLKHRCQATAGITSFASSSSASPSSSSQCWSMKR